MQKYILTVIALAVLIAMGAAAWLYSVLCSDIECEDGARIVLVDRDDSTDSIRSKLGANEMGWKVLLKAKPFEAQTGRYVIPQGFRLIDAYRKIRNHQQDPLNITLPSVRLVSQLPAKLQDKLMIDSAEIADVLNDERLIDSLGFDKQTLPAMFIPDTYEVWWNTSARDLILRLHREYKRFWNDERTALANSIGLSPTEVSTLASIVDSETANNAEKPDVAGLYMNRLHRGILLQADPTVVFAVGDFSLRRVLNKHLKADSPYNTYRHAGLPPGPIRIPSIAGIDAVLHYRHHNYIYMCAKEDFSGTHNFAATYSEHQANARRYVKALNSRGIK